MRICEKCSAQWPSKPNRPNELTVCVNCSGTSWRDVAELRTPIAPGSIMTFEEQRAAYEAARRR